jgi:hypothetical protein
MLGEKERERAKKTGRKYISKSYASSTPVSVWMNAG